HLDADPASKERLRVLLQNIAGELSVATPATNFTSVRHASMNCEPTCSALLSKAWNPNQRDGPCKHTIPTPNASLNSKNKTLTCACTSPPLNYERRSLSSCPILPNAIHPN